MWQEGQVRAKFFGSYVHTLDPKGRLTLPAKYRNHFTDKAFITPSQFEDCCLVVWTVEDFEVFANQVPAETWADSSQRMRLRSWARSTFEVELDRLGRFAVPQQLRELAHLDREALVQGALGTIEIWDPQEWERYSRGEGR
jgi:MraZ protein